MSNKVTPILYSGIAVTINGKELHCTLDYLANKSVEYIANSLASLPIGETVTIKLIGKGSYNNTNWGYRVQLPESLAKLFKLNIPHVTTFCKRGARAVDTWKAFTDEGHPESFTEITISGTVGYWTRAGFCSTPI